MNTAFFVSSPGDFAIYTGMKTSLFVALILFCLSSFARAEPEPSGTPFPMIKGTTWTYEGNITSMASRDPKTSEPIEKTVTVRLSVEVKDSFMNHSYSAAWMHGSIVDFCWYSAKNPPTEWLLLKIGTDYYTIRGGDIPGTFAKLKAAGSNWSAVFAELNSAKLYLPLPLAVGKRFSDDVSDGGNLVRGWYCWEVDSSTPFDNKSESIKELPSSFQGTEYSMSFRTNPDNMEISFIPGIGMVGLQYHHHGTTMDVGRKIGGIS